jgi:WhiB family redox-sensing transcriptional regulator
MTREWMDDALCATTDPEAFNLATGGSSARAKSICAMCDVRAECLEYALTNGLGSGVYGGLLPVDRRRLKRDAA